LRMVYVLCAFVMGACCGDCRPFDGLHRDQFMNDLCSVYVCDGCVAEIVDNLTSYADIRVYEWFTPYLRL